MKTVAALIAALAVTTARVALAAPDVLPPQEVFKYTAELREQAGGAELVVQWDIKEGYYMYAKRLGVVSDTPDVTFGDLQHPAGTMKEDEFFGEMETFRNQELEVRIPVALGALPPAEINLRLKSQGCADYGLCYPPQTWEHTVAIPASIRAAAEPPAGGSLLDLMADGPEFGSTEGEFLPPDEAFVFRTGMADGYTARVTFQIADGYYLYKDKFSFATDSNSVQLGMPMLPPGKPKTDEFFGETEVYYGDVEVLIPLSRASPQPGDFEITANYQGCAEDGICYPPITRQDILIMAAVSADDKPRETLQAAAPPISEQNRLANLIRDGSPALVLFIFFLSGLGLAFTPCVLPMVPILSGIITGQGKDVSAMRGFSLSAVYVLGMSLTYTIAGVVTAMLGQNLQAMFQHPGVLITFSAVFVVLALAMFDVYQLQMPASIQNRLNSISNQQKGGTWFGVGIMGVLSALIVGPCVAAPLAGALIFIGQSGDPVRGGAALFALSLGMGAPLLAVGASAGHLLPRAGAWMNAVKNAMGIMLLAVAVWMLSRIVPGPVTLLLWAALALVTGVVFLNAFSPLPENAGNGRKLGKAAGIGLSLYAAVLVVGATTGAGDPLQPLAKLTGGGEEEHVEFRLVRTVADLEREVASAAAAGRPVMLDFYADWCVSCKEMEKYTFNDDAVRPVLENAILLQADVTENNDDDQALLKAFGIFGPPTIAFYGADGVEREAYRLVGFVPAEQFKDHAQAAFAAPAMAGTASR
ncbi:MAG: protein-disulfide reductase DsbD [Pseudomonadota bacterium]